MEIAALGRTMAAWGYTAKQPESTKGGETVAPDAAKNGTVPTDGHSDSRLPPVRQEGRAEQDGVRSGQQSSGECETCKNRKYQDGSNDPGVSFKTPTRMDPNTAASAVRSHELEHVNREQDKARQSDRKVVSQTVTYHSAICPECGDVYVSGGETRTVTKGQQDLADRYRVGLPETLPEVGKNLSVLA